MTVDEEGNLYLSVREPTRPGVLVLDPDGAKLAFIPTGVGTTEENPLPLGMPSNVEFGLGDDANSLYITVDVSLYRIRLKARGYHRQHD